MTIDRSQFSFLNRRRARLSPRETPRQTRTELPDCPPFRAAASPVSFIHVNNDSVLATYMSPDHAARVLSRM